MSQWGFSGIYYYGINQGNKARGLGLGPTKTLKFGQCVGGALRSKELGNKVTELEISLVLS